MGCPSLSENTHQEQGPSKGRRWVDMESPDTLISTDSKAKQNEVFVTKGSSDAISPLPAESPLMPCTRVSSPLPTSSLAQVYASLWKFARFMGPGAVISVAYIDPDNYQTNISAGVDFKYKLLFVILFTNVVSIYLQALACKLGCVTGMDLAQMNRAHLHRWLNIVTYLFAEAGIICADISQVIGTAIALNLLQPKIPLVAGCAISIADTLFILLFYKPDGTIRTIRIFEMFVSCLVLFVFVLFIIELSKILAPVGQVFKGYLPSRDVFVGQGLFQSCAILGGTIMPHTIYLGSGIVQPRMRRFDQDRGTYHEAKAWNSENSAMLYRPTLSAIKSCMSYTLAELCITLFIVSVFVNSAILIIAASSLPQNADSEDIPGIYHLFVNTLGQGSGTVFALALLFSGASAGIVTTMSGQLVCEGAFNWRMSTFLRRLLTRIIAIIPAIIIAASEGQEGLAAALVGTDVVRSVTLIVITFPLLWYTSFNKYMTVAKDDHREEGDGVVGDPDAERLSLSGDNPHGTVSLANGWTGQITGWLIWLIISGMNVATLTFLGLGKDSG